MKSVDLKWTPSQRFLSIEKKDVVKPDEFYDALLECLTWAMGGSRDFARMTLQKKMGDLGISVETLRRDDAISLLKILREEALKFRPRDVVDHNFNKLMRIARKCEC